MVYINGRCLIGRPGHSQDRLPDSARPLGFGIPPPRASRAAGTPADTLSPQDWDGYSQALLHQIHGTWGVEAALSVAPPSFWSRVGWSHEGAVPL